MRSTKTRLAPSCMLLHSAGTRVLQVQGGDSSDALRAVHIADAAVQHLNIPVRRLPSLGENAVGRLASIHWASSATQRAEKDDQYGQLS